VLIAVNLLYLFVCKASVSIARGTIYWWR